MRVIRSAVVLCAIINSAAAAGPPDPNRVRDGLVADSFVDPAADTSLIAPTSRAVERTGGVGMTNLGVERAWRFEGHDLTAEADRGDGAGPLVLYAPSEADDPVFRSQISAFTGGITDYFDARVGTPSVGLLVQYDAIIVWANFAFADPIGFGDALGSATAKGPTVILGAFCTFDQGNSLLGQIREVGFSPVANPTGANFFVAAPWSGDDCGFGWYDGISGGELSRPFRDVIVLQGEGQACGHDADAGATPTTSYNPSGGSSRPVIYANGLGGAPLGPPPKAALWAAQIVLNAPGGGGGTVVDCVCDAIFSVGDRVVRTDGIFGDGPLLGTTGTVMSGADPQLFEPIYVLVAWDGFVGHDGLGFDVCPPNPTPGNGWYVVCSDLDFVAPVDCQCEGAFSVGDRVVLQEDVGGPPVGSTGTVFSGADPLVFNDLILVAWDGFEGHGGNGFDYCPPNPTPGNGWYVDCSVVAPSGGGGVIFDPPVDIGAITEPRAIGSIDFDGQNGNDVIVPIVAPTPTDPGAVAVFLNDGTGVGYERVLTQVGTGPSGVAWGEFDGINGPDAAVSNAADDTVTILLNDGAGAGTFVTSQVIAVGPTPSAIDKGDADGDSDLDLIVTHFGDGTAVLLRNDDGFFTAETPFSVGNGPRAVRFAPFTGVPGPGDGLDFVVANESDGEVVIFENDGGGGYAKSSTIPVGGSPTTLDPEDLDLDKDTDMAVGGCDTDFVTVIISDGAGGYVTVEVPAGDCPSSIDIEDMDGDGDGDIVVVTETDAGAPGAVLKGAKILENLVDQGSLQFELAAEPIVALGLEFALAARLDGDDRFDLIGASSVDGIGEVSVVTNATPGEPGDVNGDGSVDVADLLAVLSGWGPCPPPPVTCPADLDGDDVVGVGDLLEVLGNWS